MGSSMGRHTMSLRCVPKDQVENLMQQDAQCSQLTEFCGRSHMQFFGPYGPAVLVLVLPLVLYGLIFACNKKGCLELWPQLQVPGFPEGAQLFNVESCIAFAAWFMGLVLLHLVLPGKRVQGVVLPNGQRLMYKLNGEPHRGAWRRVEVQCVGVQCVVSGYKAGY